MGNVDRIGSDSGAGTGSQAQLRSFLPEPKSRLFSTVLSAVGAIASGAESGLSGIDPTYLGLLQQQLEMQQQMQLVSLYSNVEKSKHETQMSAIRNIRVG